MKEPAATENSVIDLPEAGRLGVIAAPLGRRSLAFLIDAVIVAFAAAPAIVILLTLVTGLAEGAFPAPTGGQVAVLIASVLIVDILIIVQLILHGRRGWTFGARITGIRTVNIATLERPGFWRMALRALVLYLSGVIIPIIGAIVMLSSPLWNVLGRGWLDRVGRDWMVDSRRGLDPYDAAAMRAARRRLAAEQRPSAPEFPSLATGSGASDVGTGGRSRSAVVGGGAGPVTSSAVLLPPTLADPTLVAPPPLARPVEVVDVIPVVPATPALISETRDRLDLSAPRLLIGRNPSARPDQGPVAILRVDDPTFSISKTHAEVTVHADGIRVTDRGSSNGTSVRGRDGEVRVIGGQPVHLRWGDTLMLGDREFTLTEGGSAG